MKLPTGLGTQVRDLGEQRLAGALTRADAVSALRDAILTAAEPGLVAGVVADFAGRELDAWHRAHQHSAPAGPLAEVQSELFPGLPGRLYVTPSTGKALMLCNGHDWDMARNVLSAKTTNAIGGAEQAWQQFQAAYDRVRPLLSGDLTTADVAAQLGEPSAARPA